MSASDYQTFEPKPKGDAEVGSSECTTVEHRTPLLGSPMNGSTGFLGFFSAFSCCVAPRKNHKVYLGPSEKTIGTGARSRERKLHAHRNKHAGHNHVHPGVPVLGPVDLVSPVPSSTASSASVKSSPILENWMEKFSEWRLVDIPVIPGTHHSGVNNPRKKTSQPVWGWAKTQDIGIEEQLHIGVRFFDLRIRVIVKTGEVLISHGLTSDTSLQDALDVISAFLLTHPTEGVMLYIRADKWHGIDKESSELLSKVIMSSALNVCPVGTDSKTLLSGLRIKQLGGKALILAPEGTLVDSIPSILPTCLQYCDIWQENSIDEAKAKIDLYMNTMPDKIMDDVFGGVALDGTFPIRQQSQTSRELNQWFIDRLSNENRWKDRIELRQFGIVLMDFADFDILSFFVGINNKLITIRNSA